MYVELICLRSNINIYSTDLFDTYPYPTMSVVVVKRIPFAVSFVNCTGNYLTAHQRCLNYILSWLCYHYHFILIISRCSVRKWTMSNRWTWIIHLSSPPVGRENFAVNTYFLNSLFPNYTYIFAWDSTIRALTIEREPCMLACHDCMAASRATYLRTSNFLHFVPWIKTLDYLIQCYMGTEPFKRIHLLVPS